MVGRLPVGAVVRDKGFTPADVNPQRINQIASTYSPHDRVSVTLLLQPGAPEAAFSVRIFLPRTALPILHFVAPDEVPVVGPANHIVGYVIYKILLSKFVPDRQALGAVRLFHVLDYQLFQLRR